MNKRKSCNVKYITVIKDSEEDELVSELYCLDIYYTILSGGKIILNNNDLDEIQAHRANIFINKFSSVLVGAKDDLKYGVFKVWSTEEFDTEIKYGIRVNLYNFEVILA